MTKTTAFNKVSSDNFDYLGASLRMMVVSSVNSEEAQKDMRILKAVAVADDNPRLAAYVAKVEKASAGAENKIRPLTL